MTLCKATDIAVIVGNEYAGDWLKIDPEVFYDNSGTPYGLIAFVPDENAEERVIIASTTQDPSQPFSLAMFRRMTEVNKTKDIIAITDDWNYHEAVRQLLERHGFEFEYDNHGIMFSIRKKTGVNHG